MKIWPHELLGHSLSIFKVKLYKRVDKNITYSFAINRYFLVVLIKLFFFFLWARIELNIKILFNVQLIFFKALKYRQNVYFYSNNILFNKIHWMGLGLRHSLFKPSPLIHGLIYLMFCLLVYASFFLLTFLF